MNYTVGNEFTVSKMTDKFVDVIFKYDNYVWEGALPLKCKHQGYEISLKDINEKIEEFYQKLEPKIRNSWAEEAKKRWRNQTDQTYKVFEALLSGEWECKVCGPVQEVNPQSSARIKAIKKEGYFVGTKTKFCNHCKKNTYHDILIMTDIKTSQKKIELRKPISKTLDDKIYKVLNKKESVFEQKRPRKELVIDHKFPSQRWINPESDNSDAMTGEEIKNKFQLLDNQTNLLKSRICDRCVEKSVRGTFMGIKWYYEGNENWTATQFDDEEGCIGCPWYDIEKWKDELIKKLNK